LSWNMPRMNILISPDEAPDCLIGKKMQIILFRLSLQPGWALSGLQYSWFFWLSSKVNSQCSPNYSCRRVLDRHETLYVCIHWATGTGT
jgi:hypothetical protein